MPLMIQMIVVSVAEVIMVIAMEMEFVMLKIHLLMGK